MRLLSSNLLRRASAHANSALSRHQLRSIAIGTDLTKSTTTWQNARPWHMDDGGSNLAVDNAQGMEQIFAGKKVAVFGVPAPFTGTCTYAHVPPYKESVDEFKKRGVDSIICYAVSCPYAHYNWAKSMSIDFDKISFLADVDGSWAKEVDLDRDYSVVSLGVRSERFSMIVEDGVVRSFNVVEDANKDAGILLEQA